MKNDSEADDLLQIIDMYTGCAGEIGIGNLASVNGDMGGNIVA